MLQYGMIDVNGDDDDNVFLWENGTSGEGRQTARVCTRMGMAHNGSRHHMLSLAHLALCIAAFTPANTRTALFLSAFGVSKQ